MTEQRGKYFWTAIDGHLEKGHSLTEIAAMVDSSFEELWNHFRFKRNMPNYTKKLFDYLGRETNTIAGSRLLKYWHQIVKSYTSNFKVMNMPREDPETLALRWGVKPSIIKQRLKDAGLLKESIHQHVTEVINGSSVDDVVDMLLGESYAKWAAAHAAGFGAIGGIRGYTAAKQKGKSHKKAKEAAKQGAKWGAIGGAAIGLVGKKAHEKGKEVFKKDMQDVWNDVIRKGPAPVDDRFQKLAAKQAEARDRARERLKRMAEFKKHLRALNPKEDNSD